MPYAEIEAFYRYWLYYIDPFTYLIGALLTPVAWDVQVKCLASELINIPLPSNRTCGQYMSDFLADNVGYVVDAASESSCEYCQYTTGADYLRTMNINEKYYGWRDVSLLFLRYSLAVILLLTLVSPQVGITAVFCVSSYALVFLMMKLRSKQTKTAG